MEGKLVSLLFSRHICRSEASELLRKPPSEPWMSAEESWEDPLGVGILAQTAASLSTMTGVGILSSTAA